MTSKTWLLAGVAFATLGATGAGAATKHHRVVRKTVTTTTRTESQMARELRELREQVQTLQARLDTQATAQQTVQAQAETTQSQVAAVSAKVDATQTQVAALPATVDAKIEKTKHYDRFFFKGITITPGGFVELAGIYRQHNTATDIASNYNAIPYNNVRTGHLQEGRFSARQSRVSFLAEGEVSKTVKLAMYGEFDFQGAAQTANSNESNSYNPRIRNLYGTIDYKTASGDGIHFLAGQNWSLVTLNSKGISPRNEVTPPQIDAQYVPGFAWARQPQVRVAADFLDHKLWIAASLENPQTTFFTTGATQPGVTQGTIAGTTVYNIFGSSGFNNANTLSLNHIPDIIGKVAYETTIEGHGVHLEGFAIYRALYDRILDPATGGNRNDNVSAGGFGGSLNVQVVPKKLDVQISGMTGKGIGRYGTSQLPDATFDPDGRLRPIKEGMILAGATLHATPLLDIYGFAGEEFEDRKAYTSLTGAAYGYGNGSYNNSGCNIEGSGACVGNTRSIRQATGGFWQKIYQGPFGRAQVGAQYSYTKRESFSGFGGVASQTQNMGFLAFRYYPF